MKWNTKTKFQTSFESGLTNYFNSLYDCKRAEYVATEAPNYASIEYEFLIYQNNCLEDECRGCLEVNWYE
ncbi:unnamed protein product [Debaryomyces tyrocola]|nr:unnamed protein product [Debaryomyces tyrocola]